MSMLCETGDHRNRSGDSQSSSNSLFKQMKLAVTLTNGVRSLEENYEENNSSDIDNNSDNSR
jgi:hypothetical protein